MPKNKKNKVVIITKNENLLRNSFAPLEYPLISGVINKSPRVRYKDLTADEERFFNNIFGKILNTAVHEWEWIKNFYDFRENADFDCQLCGTHIKHILKIKNNKTDKEMLIGTECVKHFGIGNRNEVDKHSEYNSKIRLMNQLDQTFPGIERIIDFWESIIDDCDYILADDNIKSYIEIGRNTTKLYNKYLKHSTPHRLRLEIIDELKELLTEGNLEKKKINQLIMDYEKNPFAPRKIYLERINDTTKSKILQHFKNGSKVDRLIGWRINNIELTRHIIQSITEDIQKNGYKLKSIIEYKGKVGVLLNSNKFSYIDFFVHHEDIAKIFCEEIFSQKDSLEPIYINKYDELTKSLKIIDYDMMASFTRHLLEQTENKFKVYETDFIDYSYNEVFIKDNKHSVYYQLDLRKLTEVFVTDYLTANNHEISIISDFINKHGKLIKKEDIDYLTKRRA